MATAHPHSPKTFWMRLAQLLGPGIYPVPLALPWHVPRAFQLTDPMCAGLLDAPAQFQAQHPMIKSLMGLGNMAFLFDLLHESPRERWPLLIAQTMHEVVHQLQHAPARFLHLGRARSHGLLSRRHLLCLPTGLLHQYRDALQTGTIGHDRRHHRLLRGQTMCHMIPRLFYPPNLEAPLVMSIRPIEADHGAAAPAMRPRDDRAMVRHQSVGRPAGLKHRCVHSAPAVGGPRLPHLPILEPLEGFMWTQDQARHIPTDLIKALSPANHVPIGSQTTAARLRHTTKRHHGVVLPLGEPPALLGLALGCGSQAPHWRGDTRGRGPLLQTIQREPPKHFYTT